MRQQDEDLGALPVCRSFSSLISSFTPLCISVTAWISVSPRRRLLEMYTPPSLSVCSPRASVNTRHVGLVTRQQASTNALTGHVGLVTRQQASTDALTGHVGHVTRQQASTDALTSPLFGGFIN